MERKSNFEAFRIVCILLIVLMHTFGSGDGQLNTQLGIFINVIGNIGVTGFVLLSGYFGIRLKAKKLIKLDLMMIFWSVLSFGVFMMHPAIQMDFGLKALLSNVLPVISHKYWFLSAYFCLCILSPFLNEYLESISRDRMKKLILAAGVLFLLLPTVFGFDQTGDGGKGILNMMLAYIVGRYIGMYHKDVKISVGKLSMALLGTVFLNFLLNDAIYLFTDSLSNYFARDNSLLTMIQAVLILLIFMQMNGSKKWVNTLAANVVAVYVLESPIKMLLSTEFDYVVYSQESYYVFIVLVVTVFVYITGCLLESLRKLIFGKAEDFIIDKIGNKVLKWKKQ